jgi:hypothetical protein
MPRDEAEAPTQQIRRPERTQPIARPPAGLDLTRSSDTARVNESTEVMSLDELMDLASEPRPVARKQPPVTLPAPPAADALTEQLVRRPAPQPAPRVAPAPKPARTEPGQVAMLAARMRADGGRMLVDARQWLETGDNGLIVGTVLVTLLLLIVIATL